MIYNSIFFNEGIFLTKSCELCTQIKTQQGAHQLLVHYKDIKETKYVLRILKYLTMNSDGGYYYQTKNDKEKVLLRKPECASILKYRHYFKEKKEIL